MTKEEERSYPREIQCGDEAVVLRYMTRDDEADLDAFAQSLPNHDLLFLRRDITQPKVLKAWLNAIEESSITSLIATRANEVVGCSAIVTDSLAWSSHVGELRVLVSPSMRSKGLGRHIIQESFIIAITLGLEKLVAQMTADQSGAINVFESLGFRAEALLRDHVKDRSHQSHDIVILSHDVAKFQAQMEAYGLTEAF